MVCFFKVLKISKKSLFWFLSSQKVLCFCVVTIIMVRGFLNLAKNEHLVRLHIGLEDPKDLIEDLRKSLKFIK